MTVVEYHDRFLSLARYAPDEINTKAKKKERFLNGLPELSSSTSASKISKS